MALGDTLQGAMPVEYVEESTFNTTPTDPNMNWVGAVNSWSVTDGVEAETVRYLPPQGSSNTLEKLQNVKVSEMVEGEMTYHPQDLTFLKYFLGGAGTLSDDLASISMGEVNDASTPEYRLITGLVGEEMSLTIEEDSVAEVSASFLGAEAGDWGTADYIDTDTSDTTSGSHAAENTAEPFSYDDLGNVALGGTALPDAVESLTVTVSNDLEVVKDPDASAPSHIVAIVPTSREITVEMSLTYDDFSLASDVRNYTAQDLTFDFPDTGTVKSWTVNDTKYPEFPYEMSPEDLIGDSLSSDPCTGLSYS